MRQRESDRALFVRAFRMDIYIEAPRARECGKSPQGVRSAALLSHMGEKLTGAKRHR